MAADFPMLKTALLAVKQISKPLANVFQEEAAKNHFFRTKICIPVAQGFHRLEVRMKMWSMNLGVPTTIPPLNEAMAIQQGAELLGEIIVFGIAFGGLLIEYNRSAIATAKKEEDKEQRLMEIEERLKRVESELEQKTREVSRLQALKKWLPKLPTKEDPPPPPPPPPSSASPAPSEQILCQIVTETPPQPVTHIVAASHKQQAIGNIVEEFNRSQQLARVGSLRNSTYSVLLHMGWASWADVKREIPAALPDVPAPEKERWPKKRDALSPAIDEVQRVLFSHLEGSGASQKVRLSSVDRGYRISVSHPPTNVACPPARSFSMAACLAFGS